LRDKLPEHHTNNERNRALSAIFDSDWSVAAVWGECFLYNDAKINK